MSDQKLVERTFGRIERWRSRRVPEMMRLINYIGTARLAKL